MAEIPVVLRQLMIAEAKHRQPDLTPCGSRKTLMDSFTYERKLGLVVFWYNTPTGTTKNIIWKTGALNA